MAENEAQRNWADLPSDILSLIYKKLRVIEVLWPAQAVCHSWRQLTFEPSVWRCIDLRSDYEVRFMRSDYEVRFMANFEVPFMTIDKPKVVREAVNRSAGNVEKLCLGSWTSDALLSSIVDRTTRLKCLILMSAHEISQNVLVEFVGRCPLLEELQIIKCFFFPDVFGYIGRACPELKCLCLNDTIYSDFGSDSGSDSNVDANDDEALEIANNMPNLCELQLIGNRMTNIGLNSILEKCVHLESLDIRECLYIVLTEEMRLKLAKINAVRVADSYAGDLDSDFDCSDTHPEYSDYNYFD